MGNMFETLTKQQLKLQAAFSKTITLSQPAERKRPSVQSRGFLLNAKDSKQHHCLGSLKWLRESAIN